MKERTIQVLFSRVKGDDISEALQKAADFIQATEICAKSTDAPKKAKATVDRNLGRGDQR